MTRYVGNGAYGAANSIHMALRGSGAATAELPEPGFIECLTTMPFGTLYLRVGRDLLVYFSSPLASPDQGITTALDALGWECREEREGAPEAALARLAEAAGRGPVLAGPLDMGALGYMPNHAQLSGSDHFVIVLGVESERVRVHDPDGYPYAALPATEFLRAWKAERVRYAPVPYTMRSGFRQARHPAREEMIRRTLAIVRTNLAADPGGSVGQRAVVLPAGQVARGRPAAFMEGPGRDQPAHQRMAALQAREGRLGDGHHSAVTCERSASTVTFWPVFDPATSRTAAAPIGISTEKYATPLLLVSPTRAPPKFVTSVGEPAL